MVKRSRIYRSVALILAGLMFITSAGFTMDMHYCSGDLKSVSFFGKAKTCHEMTGEVGSLQKSCPRHNKMMEGNEGCSEDKDCCSNKSVQLLSDQDQRVQTIDVVFTKQLKQFVIVHAMGLFAEDLNLNRNSPSYTHYKPPLIQRDIPVLNQTFLL